MPYIAELTGLDLADSAEKTRLFAMGPGVALTDHVYASGDLIRWEAPPSGGEIGSGGALNLASGGGEIVLSNLPDEITESGEWDALLGWSFHGRQASLYWLDGAVWADRVLVLTGTIEQPVADEETLRFPLSDPRGTLEAPLQTDTYDGDNVAPDGVEGSPDKKGKPRPIVYGTVSNIDASPWLVNEQKVIFNPADKACTVLCVRDGGIPLAASTIRGSLASLQANAPPAGGYDYYAGSEGTYIRLGSATAFRLTFDLQEGATQADRTHGQIWARIRTERCGTDAGDIDDASVDAVDALDGEEVGFFFTGEESRRDAVDLVLSSLIGIERQNLDGTWSLVRLDPPSGDPVVSLVLKEPGVALGPDDRPLLGLEYARPAYQPNGSPPFRVNVRWGKNNTVMTSGDFGGSAAARLKDKFASEWRVETASDAGIWDPGTSTGDFPNAPIVTIDTGYQPGADGRTCPHAASRAAYLLTLFSALDGQPQVRFPLEPGDEVLPGMVVQLVFPRHGWDLGRLFRVLLAAHVVEDGFAFADLTLGLGRRLTADATDITADSTLVTADQTIL